MREDLLCVETINGVFDFIRIDVSFLNKLASKIVHNSNTLLVCIQLLQGINAYSFHTQSLKKTRKMLKATHRHTQIDNKPAGIRQIVVQ